MREFLASPKSQRRIGEVAFCGRASGTRQASRAAGEMCEAAPATTRLREPANTRHREKDKRLFPCQQQWLENNGAAGVGIIRLRQRMNAGLAIPSLPVPWALRPPHTATTLPSQATAKNG